MDCDYCYIYHGKDASWRDMPATMPEHVLSALVREVRVLHAHQRTKPHIVFHGGEPLLMNVARLRQVVQALCAEVPAVSLSIQTNGTVYTDALQDLLLSHRDNLSFSVSVDGFEEENDRHRLGLRSESVYMRVRGTLEKAKHAGVLDNILMVVDVRNDPRRIYEFMLSAGARSYNVLLQDGDHDQLPPGKASSDSTEAGAWLLQLFALYASGTQAFRLKFFDDLALSLLLKHRGIRKPAATYAHCTMTVDTNGELKQADTYRVNGPGADFLEGKNIVSSSVLDALHSSQNRETVGKVHHIASQCTTCSYLDACGGGYPAHRNKSGDLQNPSIYCSDYMFLLRSMEHALCH